MSIASASGCRLASSVKRCASTAATSATTSSTDVLGPFVEWVPVCPEVEIGLGVPRDTLRLVGDESAPRLVVQRTGEDLTERMQRYAADKIRELEALHLDGYVLKRASPSCGLFRTRVYNSNGMPQGGGRGLFAEELPRALPALAGRRGRPPERPGAARELHRARVRLSPRAVAVCGPVDDRRSGLLPHGAQAAAVGPRSRRVRAPRASGSDRETPPRAALRERYEADFMSALSTLATRRRHTNVLQHIAGYFRTDLAEATRREIRSVIDDYAAGILPLVVPITLIRHYVRLSIAYLQGQVYLAPHPKELMLRNHV